MSEMDRRRFLGLSATAIKMAFNIARLNMSPEQWLCLTHHSNDGKRF